MRKREWLIAVLVLAAYLALRGPDLLGPFILPFETAFQEAIALHHVRQGIVSDHFLPVLTRLGDQNFYHTAHPPLLHIIYALLYRAVGVHEWVTRGLSLLLYFVSALWWRSMLGQEARSGWAVFPLAFFLPAPFILATTTNYEPLSIFMVSLIAWLMLRRDAGALWLAPVLTIGLLVDWPVYLAVPALIVMQWREPKKRSVLLGLFAYEIIFFAGLQAYQYSVTGEAAFFSHAETRANPLALVQAGTWTELGGHFADLMGAPATMVAAAALLVLIASLAGAIRSGAGRGRLSRDPAVFFILFLCLLLLTATQLVSRHYVYLSYFAPLIVFALHRSLSRAGALKIALLAVMALFLARDYILAQQRGPTFFGMADRLKSAYIKTAFASAAAGPWYFYDNIETMHPMSAAASEWIAANRPDLLHLDFRHGEVEQFTGLVNGADDYRLIFAVPGQKVLVKRELAERLPEYLIVDYQSGAGSMFIMTGRGRACSGGTWIQTRPYYGANITDCRIASYAIREPPGPWGSKLTKPLAGTAQALSVRPEIVHSLPFARSDGVAFMAMARYSKVGGREPRLLFARFMSDREPARTQSLDVAHADAIVLLTTPGPKMNASFDDAYWVEPILRRDGAAAE
ncbi:MAG TPA: hypothetical protein VM658_06675 [bacterium]|nr:hypothetical protein [bacterium]